VPRKLRLVLSLLTFVLAGGITRLALQASLPACEPKVGRFQHLNCITPAAELWPQVVIGLAAAVGIWLIMSRVNRAA